MVTACVMGAEAMKEAVAMPLVLIRLSTAICQISLWDQTHVQYG